MRTVAAVAERAAELGADRGVHLGDVGGGGGVAGADRPDRLIGDDDLALAFRALRKRAGELFGDDLDRPARLALRLAFADADDRLQALAERRFGLAATLRSTRDARRGAPNGRR
jgi:hypothetical protein